MHMIVFQLASQKLEEARNREFLSMEDLANRGKQPELFYYDPVYIGDYNSDSAEEIYDRVNHELLETRKGHPLSVSDVIAIIDEEHGAEEAVFIDSDGFEQLPGFLNQMITVNFPGDKEGFDIGHGEGCWMAVPLDAISAYERDAWSGTFEGALIHDVLSWGIPAGTVVPFEMRGTQRPVASFEWLINYKGKKTVL